MLWVGGRNHYINVTWIDTDVKQKGHVAQNHPAIFFQKNYISALQNVV